MTRVLIAEDSIAARELLVAILSADPGIEIVGTARDGHEAVEMTRRLRPDVVTMDINMPGIDGFEATALIMTEAPTPIVIISAAVDVRDVSVSMNALRAGALALERTPEPAGKDFEEAAAHLASTVKAMAGVKVVRHRRSPFAPSPDVSFLADAPASARARIIAIAASTGGPAALARILADLPAGFPVPILIVQHIAGGFVRGLASWLNTVSPLDVVVARDGELLRESTVYLASDDAHLGVSADLRIRFDRGRPIAGFRPSATHLFESVAGVFGPSAIAVVLTGMGHDGVEGLPAVRTGGGRVLSQDESSSVVFGMPRAAIASGMVDEIVPLPSISGRLIRMAGTKGGQQGAQALRPPADTAPPPERRDGSEE